VLDYRKSCDTMPEDPPPGNGAPRSRPGQVHAPDAFLTASTAANDTAANDTATSNSGAATALRRGAPDPDDPPRRRESPA
jgi:hypothetical protein